jgi:signal transduction histidine kinase
LSHAEPQRAKIHSLSRRIVWQFCIFTLLISAVYGLISFMLMYTLEDSFIEQQLEQESSYLQSGFTQTGQWPTPRKSTMQLHFSTDSLPDEIRQHLLDAPERKEFYGQQGRHYHLHMMNTKPQVMLLAEVSQDLLVRPIRDGVLQFLLLSALIITSIACMIAWLVSRHTIRPLQQLATLVDGVAVEIIPKKFAQQFPNNEIGVLARTLEQSLNRITQSLLREKNFTRDVSHELRTPLAVIKNAVELWRIQQHQQPDARPVLDGIFDAADQMEKTVQTLLILAREEHCPTEHCRTQLMPLLEQAILDNHLLLASKSVEVTLCDSCSVEINADASMLKVLLNNLLSNAFNYTSHGEVKIFYTMGQLVITDTGAGIEAEILAKLSQPGVKSQQSTGFGFGLSIVKRLCEHQGWQMDVQSNTETIGQGTQVTVSLTPCVQSLSSPRIDPY